MNCDDEIQVDWLGGARATVSRARYQLIVENIPEAADSNQRAAVYRLGAMLARAMGAFGGHVIESNAQRVAAHNRASAEIVEAWDRLMAAMRSHPTYQGDHNAAIDRARVDIDQAGRYAEALRGVIDGYRTPLPIPKAGRPRSMAKEWQVEAVSEIRSLLGVREARACAIVADLLNSSLISGPAVDPETLRQSVRNRRL